MAFPAISTGVFGYPMNLAASVAIASVRDALAAPGSVRLVRFVLFGADALAAFEPAARHLG